jgi:zinc transport system substrate-binding protein
MFRKWMSLVMFVLLAGPAATLAQGATVVASTAWTGAYARAAGAGQVVVIAPVELKHPPEYEIKPSDLDKVRGAKLVVYAGYEKFAQKLTETAGGEKVTALKVYTDNPPDNVKQQAALIADALGTKSAYDKWAKEFDTFAAQMRADAQKAYPNRKVVVHQMQRTYVEWLGFEVVGEFGPAEPSPAVVVELAQKGAVVVIDNYHNPVGQPIAESAKAQYVQFINFPGKDGTVTIEDVYRHNVGALVKVAGQSPSPADVNWLLVGGIVVAGVIAVGGALLLLRRRA